MQVSDFEFELPRQLIAKYPSVRRSRSRLLHLDLSTGAMDHLIFDQLPRLMGVEDLMVFNNTRVIPARFFGEKETGGKVEILLERVIDEQYAIAQVRASKSPKPGSSIQLEDGGPVIKVISRQDNFFRLQFPPPGPAAIAAKNGHMPLPPYIDRRDEPADEERYQTVYASIDGAVAAPTAGLHFDEPLLQEIAEKGVATTEVTLHVGAGTFQPLRVEQVEQHKMHSEYAEVSQDVCTRVAQCRANGGRVVAVGTTSVRCLETASHSGVAEPFRGDTQIFIYPGYEFKSVDAMVTNFHLPGSTLLMLVSAFAGLDNIQRAYAEAIRESYRFFSYGDAMLITR